MSALARRSSSGVVGVFLVLLGAGVVLDGDWTWRGGLLMAIGALLLALEWRQP